MLLCQHWGFYLFQQQTPFCLLGSGSRLFQTSWRAYLLAYLGANVWVFVTKSEDDGSLPYDHAFWVNFFHHENVSRCIYQGVLDYAAQVGLTSSEVHDILEPSHPCIITTSKIDHEAMQPFFAWMPTERIFKTFKHTTQFIRIPSSTYLCKHNRSANPAANIFCQGEADATNTIFSDTPAVDGGQTSAQIFTNRRTKLVTIHPSNNTDENEILGALKNCICWHGAPDELIGDNAIIYTGSKFMKYVCNLYIQLWQSESYYQHQNYAENIWQSFMDGTDCLLDFSGAAKMLAFLDLIYYTFIWNHMVDPSILDGTFSPYTLSTRCFDDISLLLYFCFNESVYCLVDQEQQHFPLKSKEICGRWVSISEHVEASMTWKIITNKTWKVICRSYICSALDPKSHNLSFDPLSSTDFCMLLSPPPINEPQSMIPLLPHLSHPKILHMTISILPKLFSSVIMERVMPLLPHFDTITKW